MSRQKTIPRPNPIIRWPNVKTNAKTTPAAIESETNPRSTPVLFRASISVALDLLLAVAIERQKLIARSKSVGKCWLFIPPMPPNSPSVGQFKPTLADQRENDQMMQIIPIETNADLAVKPIENPLVQDPKPHQNGLLIV